MPHLSAIYRYPVKSCRGQTLTAAELGPIGLPDDRAWMWADASGYFLTGRDWPRMALIQAIPAEQSLALSAPGMPPLTVLRSAFATPHQATVWRDGFRAWTGSAEADAWGSQFLGQPVQFLYIGMTERRVARAPEVPLGFADAFPLLLIGEASRRELSQRVGRDMAMARFRPNLVVDGAEPFAEDGWHRIQIGNLVFSMGKPCIRCVFTTVDPDTAQRSPDQEPLRTLANYRKGPDGVMFGQNAMVHGHGRIEVGMPVTILD